VQYNLHYQNRVNSTLAWSFVVTRSVFVCVCVCVFQFGKHCLCDSYLCQTYFIPFAGKCEIEICFNIIFLARYNKLGSKTHRMLTDVCGDQQCLIHLSVVQDFWTNEKMCTVIQNFFDPKTRKRFRYLKSLKFDMQWSPFGDESDAVMLKWIMNQLAWVIEELYVRKVYVKMVPIILVHDQKMKQNLHWPCSVNWKELNIVNSAITSGESWIFQYDSKLKGWSLRWPVSSSDWQEMARMLCSKSKMMLIVLFDTEGIMRYEWWSTDTSTKVFCTVRKSALWKTMCGHRGGFFTMTIAYPHSVLLMRHFMNLQANHSHGTPDLFTRSRFL
jgi:hypothetical protein